MLAKIAMVVAVVLGLMALAYLNRYEPITCATPVGAGCIIYDRWTGNVEARILNPEQVRAERARVLGR